MPEWGNSVPCNFHGLYRIHLIYERCAACHFVLYSEKSTLDEKKERKEVVFHD